MSKFIQLFLMMLLTCANVFADTPKKINPTISLELHDTNLVQAIQLLAKFLDINVLISPAISGTTNINLHNANPEQAFNILLTANSLNKWRTGNIWYIATNEELLKREQDQLKWQEVSEDSQPLINKIWHIRYAKAQDILKVIQNGTQSFLSKRGKISVDERTNLIYIQDIAENVTKLSDLIKQLDIAVQQIVIEARLVSIDNGFEQELGISFNNVAIPVRGSYSIAVAKLADGSLLDVKLSALENAGHANLISSPSLFTANGQGASIEAGEEVPYQEVSESGGTAIVFKKAVLGLQVTPQILPNNKVLLQLQINQDRPSSKLVLGMPTITTRQIISNILIKNGQTIVLGGIYETNTDNGEQRIPFLSQLPLLGGLFKQYSTQMSKRELLIFVTPKIIASNEDR